MKMEKWKIGKMREGKDADSGEHRKSRCALSSNVVEAAGIAASTKTFTADFPLSPSDSPA
jgi:hypothetical protein